MLYFNADPRDGGIGGTVGGCQPCCCQPIMLRPGETNLVVIDYTQWALPIGWVVPTMEFSIVKDSSTCDGGEIDGFAAPGNVNYSFETALNTALEIDLTEFATPANNTFSYEAPLPLSGPNHGGLVDSEAPGLFAYQPVNGYKGYDYFDYEMTDAQGRSIIRTVEINVGAPHKQMPDPKRMSDVPWINRSGVQTDSRNQLVRFPIYMPTNCRACDSYRLTVKQPAKDCDGNVYNHFACFDIRCSEC